MRQKTTKVDTFSYLLDYLDWPWLPLLPEWIENLATLSTILYGTADCQGTQFLSLININ